MGGTVEKRNVTHFSFWMSNNQMVHFIFSYRAVLEHFLRQYVQLPQIASTKSKLFGKYNDDTSGPHESG